MATNEATSAHRRAVIGNEKSFWIYDSNRGFDLTHPETPESPAINPSLTMKTTTSPVTIDPAKSAIVIIDMQNYFLSPAFGRQPGAGHAAYTELLEHAIPAARRSGTRIIWLNWGLTDSDLASMPPAVSRAFGFSAQMNEQSVPLDKYGDFRYKGGHEQLEDGSKGRKYAGLGAQTGIVVDDFGGKAKEVDGGRLLCRDSWNAALYGELAGAFDKAKGDVWVHKNRMSGLWGSGTELEAYLQKEGLKTLLFAGVNTDQCVGGTYQDAFSKGYDCILLSDGCGTTSPTSAQQCIEHNAANTWGFLTSCKDFADGAASI